MEDSQKPSFDQGQRPSTGKEPSASSHAGGPAYSSDLNNGAVVKNGGHSNAGQEGRATSFKNGQKDV